MAKAGDIALFRGKKNSFIDEAIEFFTNPPYTHSACFVDDHTVTEMWWNGCRYRDITNETGYDVFTCKVPRTKKQINNGVKYAKSKVGKTPYNFLELIGIIIEKITGHKHNIFYSIHAKICSQYTSEILNKMNDDPCPNIEDASTTPADLGCSFKLVKIESH